MAFDYVELLLSSGALTHMLTPRFPLHPPTSFRVGIIHLKLSSSHSVLQCLVHSPVWLVGAYPSIAYLDHLNTSTLNRPSKPPDNAE